MGAAVGGGVLSASPVTLGLELQSVGGFCSAGSVLRTRRPMDLAVGINAPSALMERLRQALLYWPPGGGGSRVWGARCALLVCS